MLWLTSSVETSEVFNKNIFPNVTCRKAKRIGSPFNE